MSRFLLLAALVAGSAAVAQVPASPYPPPKALGPVETYGANVQRAMHLLATSTPQKRNTVRVMFYGQSITGLGTWAQAVTDDLRRRFPHAAIVAENRAIGGFHAEYLVQTAEADLYPFYPDLVFFHVYAYGKAMPDYEAIVRRLRERTTADILHQTDHISTLLDDQVDEETDPAKLTPERKVEYMNHVFLPGLSRRYQTELVDVRGAWKAYMRDYGVKRNSLLSDVVHLNPHGDFLMAEIVKSHLRYRPDLPDTGWRDRVRTFEVGKDVSWQGGRLVLPFDGNRVDLVCKPGAAPPAAVRIDGKKPSEFPDLYTPTRAYVSYPRGLVPPLLQVGAEAPRVVENWSLVVTHMTADRSWFKYRVTGSVTGPDGEGETGKRFVSKSGRVVIDPPADNLAHALSLSRDPKSNAYEVRWSVVPQFADTFTSPGIKDPTVDTVVTVAQGLPNGRHTLEITGTPDTPIAAVRVFRPPLVAAK